MSDSRFEPINKAHAIVEMVLFFELEAGGTDNGGRLLPLREELIEDFPRSNLIESVEFHWGQPQQQIQPNQSKIDGIELQRFKPDGSFEWLIRANSKVVSIHCLEYTRWHDIWPRVNKYADAIFSKLAGVNVKVSSLGLKYVDQFEFCGDLKAYDANLLFSQNSTLLHPRAFRSGARWHCHSGWFEEVGEIGEVLSQMNIDSTVNIVQREQKSSVVTIEHTLALRAQSDTELAKYAAPGSMALQARSQIAEWMHQFNKRMLTDLLASDMCIRISLYAEDDL